MSFSDEDELVRGMRRLAERDLLVEILKDHKERLEALVPALFGKETIPIECFLDIGILTAFVTIDLLGYFCEGESTSASAVSFMRKYMGQIDPRYAEASGLLYHCIRHGWVHRSRPERLKLERGKLIRFLFSNDPSREGHLSLKRYADGNLHLVISLPLVYQDLKSAIDLYLRDIEQNGALLETSRKVLLEMREPEEEQTLRGRKYFLNSDIEFLVRQLPKE